MNHMNPTADASLRAISAKASRLECPSEPPTAVRGWASENYAIDDEPAVIINPQATALTLLSWAHGQLQQCNALLYALGSGDGLQELDVSVSAAALHFLKQTEIVQLQGMNQLRQLLKTAL